MFCNCVWCAMAIKHQERITVANADGNYSFNIYFYNVIFLLSFFTSKEKKKKNDILYNSFTKFNMQKFNQTCMSNNVRNF